MALRLCSCGHHAKTTAACPFCGADDVDGPRLRSKGRRPRAAAFAGVAAVTVACAARTELGVVSSDASPDSPASVDGATDAKSFDAHADGVVLDVDAHVGDAIEECVASYGACTTNGDCCSGFCGWQNRCDVSVPPYGSPVPPD